ncbi:hypothetical protein [Flavobacterium sp. GT3P67]|uniref:hypothetical protein n=1 Tax=Flavobacterium sp. GT3P67 TaxID=2541722 RepID=UPI00104CF06F|nr:hypothetical protein [Flavobacterium sp. GT3P67]TDE48413.1 hypothetical protein E0H99_16885 [Flavobacterium sp. GT3P67]
MKYSIKVWIFTILASPLFLFLILGVFIHSTKFSEILEAWPMIGFMMIYGLVLSIPAMLVFWLIEEKLVDNSNNNKAKLILSAYSFISVWLTFYIFDKGFAEPGFQQIFWVVIYSLTIVLGVWIFKRTAEPEKNGHKS